MHHFTEKDHLEKIGFGGGCHWCTEAIFQSLKGVKHVDQGWISSMQHPTFSEAVIVYFDASLISLEVLIEIHLRTHSSTSNHNLRQKYRSAVYTFSPNQHSLAKDILNGMQSKFELPLVTTTQDFKAFKRNTENYIDYYSKNPEKPFCRNVIDPKLHALRKKFEVYSK